MISLLFLTAIIAVICIIMGVLLPAPLDSVRRQAPYRVLWIFSFTWAAAVIGETAWEAIMEGGAARLDGHFVFVVSRSWAFLMLFIACLFHPKSWRVTIREMLVHMVSICLVLGSVTKIAWDKVAAEEAFHRAQREAPEHYLRSLQPKYENGRIIEINWQEYATAAGHVDRSHLRRARISADLRFNHLVSFLRECPQLESLECVGKSANKLTVSYVQKLPKLRRVVLQSSNYDGESLELLADLPALAELDLATSAIADARLADIATLLHLKFLNLSDTQVTDAGLSELLALKNLESLWLDGTAVTDAGLATLAQLPALKELHVARTRVTPAGIAAFRSQRADIVVIEAPADGK